MSPSIAKLRNSYDIIPVSIDNEMGGFRNTIPRSIELELKYFQVSKGKKRLVEATMFFDQLCTTQAPEHFGGSTSILSIMEERGILPCEVDINGIIKSDRYDLKIQYFALGWFDLLNRFEFGGSVYFLFYTIMGLAICFIGGFVYTMNRLLTKLRHPPSFQGWSLIQLVSRPQIEGVAFALVPYMTVILTIHSCFGNDPIFNFDSIHKNWLSSGVIHDKDKIENAMGRMGSALLVLGFYLTCKGSRSIIPILEGKTENDASENKHAIAKRAHFIWASICLQAVMLCIWEFSYSDTYKNDIYRFVVIFKVSHILFDVIISQVIKDKLLVAPLLVTIQMTEILVTIGARDFIEFTLSFLVEVSLVVFQRLFLYPLIKTMSTLWPRWKMLASQTFGRKGITRQEKKELEFRWKKVNEDIELQSEGVEPLLHSISIYSIEKTGGILVPFLLLFLMLIYRETEVAMNYNINQHELLYYGTFAFYMILWMCFVDAFVLSSQELIYGWRVYDYFSYQRWRFANRESRWNLLSQVDESLTQSLQTLDLLCFSSQYYFILTLLTLGFCTNMFAITICLRRKYNFLADPVFPFVVVAVVLCCEAASMICVYVSNTSMDTVCWRGVWKISQLQGTMDDVIAAKLAIGEGRQEDLEQERQELQALNSEAFRHKFIEKNRPWVLQHLVELVTPRSLQDTGPDGRPLADYIRDIYSNLMNIGEVTKRAGDRSDISSDDSSDDDFEKRRLWDRTPLEGNRLLIAQIWLQKARKRGVFAKAVSSIIQKRREDHCSVCSRTLSSCTSLTAGLASDGNFDIYAIDCLIRQFEDHYSSQESDPTLWKAFFRENAKFMTVCNICLDQVEQHKLHKNIRHVGAGLPTRPGDISSDDESEDDIFYDPLVVVRSSNDGKMMNKWLWAARHKLGGEFPRRGAAKQTEKYLRRLKTRTIDRTKHVGRPKSCDGSKVNTQEDWGMLSLGDPGKMIMARWLSDARKTTRTRFNRQAEDCI